MIWGHNLHMTLLTTVFFNSIITCPMLAYMVRRDRQAALNIYKGLEWLDLDSELRILACIHSPHDVPAALRLIEISSGRISRNNQYSNLASYILNLIELTSNSNYNTSILSHQLQPENYNNNDNQAHQVSFIVDKFVRDTNIHVHQIAAISRLHTMHTDLHHNAQDLHASLVIVPFHRRLQYDGKMAPKKKGIQHFNVNVLRHAQCSVGILVDRGMANNGPNKFCGATPTYTPISSLSSSEFLNVAVIFLGGPDNREAASYAARLALHPYVNVTMVRFLWTQSQGSRVNFSFESDCSMLMEVEDRVDQDEEFMTDFYNKFVVTRMITYDERRAANSTEFIRELSSMVGLYNLFVVGRQIQGATARLTKGMSEWEECPELGSVGDLLASSDFMAEGSVLVIKQYDVTH